METETYKEALHGRLQRVISQCGNISRMVERDASCKEIVHKIGQVKSAMHEIAQRLLAARIREGIGDGHNKADVEKSLAQFKESMHYLIRMHR